MGQPRLLPPFRGLNKLDWTLQVKDARADGFGKEQRWKVGQSFFSTMNMQNGFLHWYLSLIYEKAA